MTAGGTQTITGAAEITIRSRLLISEKRSKNLLVWLSIGKLSIQRWTMPSVRLGNIIRGG